VVCGWQGPTWRKKPCHPQPHLYGRLGGSANERLDRPGQVDQITVRS
jgi:hypothetical protein